MSSKKARFEMTSDLPNEAAAIGQNSVDQAKAAFDKAGDVTHNSVQSFDAAATAYRNGLADIQMKAVEFTQNSAAAAFAHTRRLFTVKEPAEFFSLQQEFLRQQAETFQRQTAELGQLSLQLARETVKPVQDTMAKAFGDFSKTFSA